MRRAFQARLLSVDPRARRVLRVRVERLGGYMNRSWRLRYTLTLLLRSGRRRQRILRGSSELQDETRRQAYVIMKFLWRHGFDTGPLQIARPVTFFWRWKLLVYEQVAGATLASLLRRQPERVDRHLEAVAKWLVRLHHHSPRTIRLVYNSAGRAQYWRSALDILRGPDSVAVAGLQQTIERVMRFEHALARSRRRVLVHHDFHPGNILITPRSLRVVDFAESRLSHPLIDVAAFFVQLELQAGSTVPTTTVVRWQQHFLAAYHGGAPNVRLTGALAERLFRFVRFRVALQSYLGVYLLGRPYSPLRQAILAGVW
ncbi:MAG: aminoglycoside phosphotransferase family protein [Candidatus Kerfeldbacteria bacterium]|nr:aminoglycoside phosphotransferase family protein [Candidatus Kerfeldbacteria bacterium]